VKEGWDDHKELLAKPTTEAGLVCGIRGQIATNSAKGLGPSKTAETPGDLLLDLDHPQIALGEIVVKIHAKILQEAEEGLLVFAQPIEETLGQDFV
jgi:hypothetical protein